MKQKQTSKDEKKKSSIEVIAEQYSANYDTFMMNIAHLKVSKAFTQIDVVKRGKKNISNPLR